MSKQNTIENQSHLPAFKVTQLPCDTDNCQQQIKNQNKSERSERGTAPIYKYLQKCYTNKDKQNYKETTHVSLNPENQGCYIIKNNKEFEKFYLQTLEEQQKNKKPLLFLAEKRHDTSQILIDLDFQRSINQNDDFFDNFDSQEVSNNIDFNDRLYTTIFIKVFINQYMKHLQTYMQIKEQTKIYILEKTRTYNTNNGYIKDGIHIQIPGIVVPLKDQGFIRKKILNDSVVLQQYNNLNLSQPFCKCFDNSATKNVNWLLYGSQKPNNEPYYCNQIYIYNPNQEDQQQQQNQEEEIQEEQEKKKETKNDNILQITDEELTDSDDEIDEQQYQLQNIDIEMYGFEQIRNNYSLQHLYNELNVQQRQQNVEYTELYQEELQIIQQKELSKHLAQQKINKVFNESQEENVQLAKQLVQLLSDDRADNYDDWMHVGWCCRNISDDLYDTWIDFSQKSSKFDPEECYTKWQDFEKRNMTIASLKYWAKQDSPEQYQQIINRSVNKYVNQAQGQFNHFNVALVVYHMYKGQFICSNASKKQWWQFSDHRWKNCDNAYLLHNYISTEVKEVFTQRLMSLSNQQKDYKIKLSDILHQEHQQEIINKHDQGFGFQQNTSNPPPIDEQLKSQKSYYDSQIKNLEKEQKKFIQYLMKLGENSFKSGVVRELANIFLQDDPNFLDKLDNNPNLLCFNNGVYDLDRGVFRNGVPTDYVTLSTGYDFLTNIDKNDQNLKEIKKYMKQVFVNEDTRTYIWKLFASFLSGTKLDEKFYFMNGCGSNSKSVLLKLLSQSLGDYSTNISVTAVTGKRTQSAQANPEIAASKTARLVIMQEPGNHDQLNIGVVKEFSGNDRIRARMLYDNGTQFTPKFRMVLVCNHLPEVSSQDDGTWRRIQVITFKSRFCLNPDKSKNEFKIKSSADIDSKIQRWVPYFMYLLIQCYKTIPKSRPLSESDDIKKDTLEYKRSNNVLLCFLQDKITVLQEKKSSPISISDIYQEYGLYCRQYNYSRQKINEVRIFLNKQLEIQDLKNDEFFNIDFK